MTDEIRFYGRSLPFFEFSNFYHAPFRDHWGQVWDTTEHYFQAMKFAEESKVCVVINGNALDIPIRQWIRSQSTPKLAATEGRRRDLPLRKDWETVKDDIMYKALYYKFEGNEKLKKLLLSTGSSKIIEASPIDYYWGEGKNKTGKNVLGKLLMILREKLYQGPNQCDGCKSKMRIEKGFHFDENGQVFMACTAKLYK